MVGRWLAGALVVGSCVLAGAAARAQSNSTPAARDALTVYRADEILVEEDPDVPPPTEVFTDTPVEREVLPRAEVERRPGTSAADLLRTLPGVRQQQRIQGEEAAVSIEGLPPEFTRGLVDGERYTGEIGAVDDFHTLPLFDAERMAVLRGAQSLRYGSDAAGGVVRIDTPDPPRNGLHGRFEGGYGGSNWVYGAGSAGWGNERAGAWLRFVNDEIDGFDTPGDHVPEAVGKQAQRVSRDVYGKLRVDPLAGLGLLTRFGWRSDDESGLSGESGVGDREERRWFVGQHGEWAIAETTRLVASLTWYDNELRSDVGRSFDLREREPSGRLALEHLFETGPASHGLTVGFDAFAPRLDLRDEPFESEVGDPLVASGDVDEGQAFGGLYAILESDLTSWLRIEGGARAQLHSDYAPELLPQVAVLVTPWQPDEERFLRLRASFGMGYRTPSLRDLYQPPVFQDAGYFLSGSPTLVPEHVRSARVGFEAVPVAALTVSATAFSNHLDDHIRSVLCSDPGLCAGDGTILTGYRERPPLTPAQELLCQRNPGLGICDRSPIPQRSPLYVKTNLDEVETRGVESRVRLRPLRGVELGAAWTYLQTEVSDTTCPLEELPNEPHHVVDLLAGFELPRARTRVTALGRWRGEALTETTGTGSCSFASLEASDPSFTLDLRLVQPLGETPFELYADLFNLTDERIVDSYVVRGRTWFVGLRGRF